ncbi:hypothetical protein [Sphingopyxis yananensis]|uniref:hypothetical protein n=1 Tax=Sphingopyxis yananensis TaxID=2886687 RepID=UPI001D100378|nr:hypothetical protein [Sphingopyxis yananensis]MCC2603633.1 hypothetical protein [Sphingopyxis yananensis]
MGWRSPSLLAILIAPPAFPIGAAYAAPTAAPLPEMATNPTAASSAETMAQHAIAALAAPSAANLVPLDVPLTLNDKFLGTISIAVDAKGDGEIDARRLVDLLSPIVSPKILTSVKTHIAGKDRVKFSDLISDNFNIFFDPFQLQVAVTLPADATAPTDVRIVERDAAPNPSEYDQPYNFSAGVNLSVTQRYVHQHNIGFEPLSIDMDALLNIGGFDGVTVSGGMRYVGTNDDKKWERQEIRATRDFFKSAIRATAGEFTPSSVAFQGSSRILGLGLERAYSTIRPFQNVRPIGRRDFIIDQESSVDVYVNDIRIRTIRLAPGRYNIGDFPFASGPNNVRLVVENVGGRQEILDFSIFSGAELLSPGITDFGVSVGLREGDNRLRYHSPAATAYAYHGLSDTITLGLNGQATDRGLQIGGSVMWGSPLGFLQVEASGSRSFDGYGSGLAISADYRGEFSLLTPRDLRLNITSLYRSRNFQDAFSSDVRNIQALQSAALLQWRAPYGISLGLGYSYTDMRENRRDIHRIDANLGRTFGRFSINSTASRISNEFGVDWRVSLGVSIRLGKGWYSDYRFDSGTNRHEVEISRTSEGKLGEVSGNLRLTTERDSRAVAGRVAYINNRFDLVVNHNRIEARTDTGRDSVVSDWNIRSFIGYADGSFGIGRTINDGFILAPAHRSLKDSQIMLKSGDRIVAKSGFFGPALVPINRAYGINRYEVLVDPLPVGYDIGSGVINSFPGYGSGYHMMIGSDASHIASGYLIGPTGPLSLITGTVVAVDNDAQPDRPFFTNRSGRFVADRLSPGRYQLKVHDSIIGEFFIAKDTEGLVDVGTITTH